MSDYHKAYERLLSLSNLITKPYTDSKHELRRSLKRMRAFLDHLGAPDTQMDIIHVAGTSGKGSVVAMMRSILHEQGERVGSYSSPHTTTYLERFANGNHLLSPDRLASSIDAVVDAYQAFLAKQQKPLSFFELSTAIALYAFAQEGMKWCVLEAGCGGRFDATNVIQTPRVAIITNINKDHTQVLGSSLKDIAHAKAGIIKNNGVVYCGETRPTIRKVFMKEANKHNAALFFVNPPHTTTVEGLQGMHQQHNAAIASAAAQEIGIENEVIQRALSTISLPPCRFEEMQSKPRVILDGAHSPIKIKALVRQLESVNSPIHIIFGASANKKSKQMIEQLATVATSITTTRFTGNFKKAANPFSLLTHIGKQKQAGGYLDPFEALEATIKNAKKSDLIVITGSLYLCGELRTHWIPEAKILKEHSSFRV